MVEPKPQPRTGAVQTHKIDYGFSAIILDSLDDQPLVDALQECLCTRRRGYHVRAMWRGYIAKFLTKIRFNNQLSFWG